MCRLRSVTCRSLTQNGTLRESKTEAKGSVADTNRESKTEKGGGHAFESLAYHEVSANFRKDGGRGKGGTKDTNLNCSIRRTLYILKLENIENLLLKSPVKGQ